METTQATWKHMSGSLLPQPGDQESPTHHSLPREKNMLVSTYWGFVFCHSQPNLVLMIPGYHLKNKPINRKNIDTTKKNVMLQSNYLV